MSVYIKGMEMPTRCAECRLSTVHSFKDRPLCDVLVEYMSYGEWEVKRLDNCPLVQVPPHGRLIDADGKAFPTPHRNPSNDYMKGWNACLRSVQQQPIVIPAEQVEEKT